MGKDTAAKYLEESLISANRSVDVVRCGFADQVKRMAYELYGWAGLRQQEYYEENPEKRFEFLPSLGKTPVEIWIGFANRIREFNPDSWADYVLKNVVCDFLIITDLRFQNELDKIKKVGGIIIKVNRTDVKHIKSESDDALKDFTGWDHVLEDMTLAEVKQFTRDLAEKLIYG